MKLSISKFWNPDRTVRFDRKNLESFIFAVLLASRTVLCAKNRDPCKPRSNLTILRTMIRPLLTVPYFPLNLNLKKIKKKLKKKKTHTHTHTHYLQVFFIFSSLLLFLHFCLLCLPLFSCYFLFLPSHLLNLIVKANFGIYTVFRKKKLWIVCASNYLVSLTDFGTRVPAQNSNYSGVFYKRCYRH